jgi:hypothetical protein
MGTMGTFDDDNELFLAAVDNLWRVQFKLKLLFGKNLAITFNREIIQ